MYMLLHLESALAYLTVKHLVFQVLISLFVKEVHSVFQISIIYYILLYHM